jgi:GNAT superfamily N-acetyltransferase
LTIDQFPHLEELFGRRGACGGCWCMAWRVAPSQWKSVRGEPNKTALKRLVRKGPAPGVIAFDRTEPVAWCAVAPRTAYSYLGRSRVLAAVDDVPVWSISCLFVERSHRRLGLSTELISAAARLARSLGGTVVEGYPVDPGQRTWPDAFAWTGLVSSFRHAGFREVARRSPRRPIMRFG